MVEVRNSAYTRGYYRAIIDLYSGFDSYKKSEYSKERLCYWMDREFEASLLTVPYDDKSVPWPLFDKDFMARVKYYFFTEEDNYNG